MVEICEYKQIFGLILVTVVLVLSLVEPTVAVVDTVADEAVAPALSLLGDGLAAISDKFPDKVLDWDFGSSRFYRRLLMAWLMPKMLYLRQVQKYKKQIKKNRKNQWKYRTIVPVSIVPSIIAAARFNRDRHSEYYIVGADDTVDPTKPQLPNEFNEIPDDSMLINALKYQHN